MININRTAPDKHSYTKGLASIDKPPKLLYYLGTLPETRRPSVAVVGSRKPTAYGKAITYRLAYDCAKSGLVIVSGLALGVDGIAHRAALEANGTTIAVLPCGLPKIYPASHHTLAMDIVHHGGALVTEYDSDHEFSYQSNFLERNRIVSGLADAIIITEAAIRSGTLSTAAHALAQGKDVFVVPGNITSPMSAGCNALLKQGANVITEASDILDVIAPQLSAKSLSTPLGNTAAEAAIIAQLQAGVNDGETIQKNTKLPATELNTAFTMLEIAGTIRALGGNRWTLLT